MEEHGDFMCQDLAYCEKPQRFQTSSFHLSEELHLSFIYKKKLKMAWYHFYPFLVLDSYALSHDSHKYIMNM